MKDDVVLSIRRNNWNILKNDNLHEYISEVKIISKQEVENKKGTDRSSFVLTQMTPLNCSPSKFQADLNFM